MPASKKDRLEKKPTGIHRVINLVRKNQTETQTTHPAEQTALDEGIPINTPQTYLIVGLGNPGKEYAETRHNIGFMAVDQLANKMGIKFSRVQNRALITDGRINGHRVILVKPQTYMNESGQAVAALVRFYKVPLANLLVAYDDMDIPLGTIRIRPKGGSGGQKGMKSIIQRLGNQQDFPRLRLGLGRPPGQMPPPAYLLQNFSKGELELLTFMLNKAVEAIMEFVTNGLNAAMNQYNGSATE